MRYFATADDQETINKKKKKSDGSMTEVEEQILGNLKSIEKTVTQHDNNCSK
jgi:hypothetical protein